MRLAAIAALALAAAALLLLQPSATNAQPEVIFMFPEDGDILAKPPPIIRLCFAAPVNIRDLDKGGDFKFSVLKPDSRGLGLRIVFRTDGLGVDIHPGLSEEPPEGRWTFEWRVTDPYDLEPSEATPEDLEASEVTPEDLEAREGTVRFTVVTSGSPVPEEVPGDCSEGGTTEPDVTPTSDVDEDDDDSDVLLIAVIAIASVAGAAVLGFVLYLVRRRIGAGPDQTPPSGD